VRPFRDDAQQMRQRDQAKDRAGSHDVDLHGIAFQCETVLQGAASCSCRKVILRSAKAFALLHPRASTPGKSVKTDFVYVMEFDGEKIRHMTKIWHAGLAMKELGWI